MLFNPRHDFFSLDAGALKVESSAIYSVAFHPNNQTLAAAGSDGKIRFINAATGVVEKEFNAAPLQTNVTLKSTPQDRIGNCFSTHGTISSAWTRER